MKNNLIGGILVLLAVLTIINTGVIFRMSAKQQAAVSMYSLDFNKSLFTNKTFDEIIRLDTILKDDLFQNIVTDTDNNLCMHVILNKKVLTIDENTNYFKKILFNFLNVILFKKSLILFPNKTYLLQIREELILNDSTCNISLLLSLTKELKDKGLLLLSNNEVFLDTKIFILVQNYSDDLIIINEGDHIVNGLITTRNF
jgi:hypothetical protein